MCSLCRLPIAKNQNFRQILTLGACTSPLLPTRAKFRVLEQTHNICLLAKFRLNTVYSVGHWLWKTPIFASFWTLAFSGVANWQQSDKVEHGCTSTNLPLPNGIKIVSVLQRLHGEIECTNSDIQKRDEQTNKQTARQTKNSTFLATPAAGEIRALPNLAWC